MKEKIIIFLEEYLKKNNIDFPKENILIFKSHNDKYGDFNTNLPLKLKEFLKKDSLKISEDIKNFLSEKDLFSEITISKPGFINFFINLKYIVDYGLLYFNKDYKEEFSDVKKLKINYEFVSANPTGYLHVGHARNAIIGESTVNILKYIGHDVLREFYINDGGNQINSLLKSLYFHTGKKLNIDLPKDLENSEYNGYEITNFADYLAKNHKDLFLKNDYQNALKKLYPIAVEYFLNEIKIDLARLNISPFDSFISENKLLVSNAVNDVISKLKKTKHFYEKNGAWWLNTSKFGDEKDRVLIKSDGSLTYMVPDIANHVNKYERNFDLLINLWGSDHHGYESRIKAACEILGYDPKKLEIDYISMVKLLENGKEFKMSKRKGTAIKIRDILEKIDVGIFKYSILAKAKTQMHSIDFVKINIKDMNNPYWYIQYANSRIYQLLAKVDIKNLKLRKDYEFLGKEEKERNLLLIMNQFQDEVLVAAKSREPLVILNYLKTLATAFHSYYNSCVVINKNIKIQEERLILIISLQNLLNRIFSILKINIITKM